MRERSPRRPDTALAGEATPGYRIARTELVWPGKYDERGALRLPARPALPLQVLEVIGEAAQGGWRNKLIWGENLFVLSSLLGGLAGQVDLIYVDPPFLAGRDFMHSTVIDGLRTKAYYDTWSGGRDAYLAMLWQRMLLARELLSERGSIYFHVGPGVNHYVRTLLDEIFGAEAGTEIVWKRTTAHADSRAYGTVHDKILFYTRTDRHIWNEQHVPHGPQYVRDKYTGRDPDGRRYMLDNMTSPNPRPNMIYVWRGHEPPAMGWRYSKQTMAELDAQGRIWYPDSKSKRPRLKRYLDESRGVPLSSIWTDINPVNSQANEDTAYDTQKPEALLERIIAASSDPDSIVLDFFCGAGTTLAVAERLGRRWIGCDLGRCALHTSLKRLLECRSRSFEVLSLGGHERKYWQGITFGTRFGTRSAARLESACRGFILGLYGAQPAHGTHIHGSKDGALVHVGAADTAVTAPRVEAAVAEAKLQGARELHVLAWEWEMGLPERFAPRARSQPRLAVRLFRIPREVMESRAVEAGDVHFWESAGLELDVSAAGSGSARDKRRKVRIRLASFVMPSTARIPAGVRDRIRKWSDYIDYWAVDWDFHDPTFASRWQSYRTRRKRTLQLQTSVHTYPGAGRYRVLVRVIDIFGNETRRLVSWEVR